MGQEDEILALEAVVDRDPTRTESWLELGKAYEAGGSPGYAIGAYRWILRCNREHAEAAERLTALLKQVQEPPDEAPILSFPTVPQVLEHFTSRFPDALISKQYYPHEGLFVVIVKDGRLVARSMIQQFTDHGFLVQDFPGGEKNFSY
jgi:hypothetical protein